MPLAATHIRFAVDVMDAVPVTDLDAYVSGTIYPDSRYITGLQRSLTHSAELIPGFLRGADDFKKGWAVHLVCDREMKRLAYENFPEFFAHEDVQGTNDAWVSITAVKVLQDVEVLKDFSIIPYLSGLDHVENPNYEDLTAMTRYNNIFKKAYSTASANTPEMRYDVWTLLGLDAAIKEKIQHRVEVFRSDTSIMERISGLYVKMLSAAESSLQ